MSMQLMANKINFVKVIFKSQRALVIVAGVCLIFIVFYSLVLINIHNTEVQENQQELAKLKLSYTSRYRILTLYRQDKHIAQLLQRELEEKQKKIIDPKSITSMYENITKLAEKNQLHVISFKPESRSLGDYYSSQHVHMVATGEFVKLTNFLQQLRTLNAYIGTKKFSLDRETGSNKLIQINSIFDIYTKFTKADIKEKMQSEKEKAKQKSMMDKKK